MPPNLFTKSRILWIKVPLLIVINQILVSRGLDEIDTNSGKCWRDFHNDIWFFHGLDGIERGSEGFNVLMVSPTLSKSTTEKDSRNYRSRLTEQLSVVWEPGYQETASSQWPFEHGQASEATEFMFRYTHYFDMPRTRLSARETDQESLGVLDIQHPYPAINYTIERIDNYNSSNHGEDVFFFSFLQLLFYDGRTGEGLLDGSGRFIDLASFHCPPNFCWNVNFDAMLEWVSDDGKQILGHDIIFGRFLLRKPNFGIPRLLNFLDFYNDNPYMSIQAINMFFRDTEDGDTASIYRVYFLENRIIIAKPLPVGDDRLKYEEERVAEISGSQLMGGELDCYSGPVEEQVGCIVWFDYERSILHAMNPRGDAIERFYLTKLNIAGAKEGKPWRWERMTSLSFLSHFVAENATNNIRYRKYWQATTMLSSLVGSKNRPLHIFRDGLVWPVENDNGGLSNPSTISLPVPTYNYFFNMFSYDGITSCGLSRNDSIEIFVYQYKINNIRNKKKPIAVIKGLTLEAARHPILINHQFTPPPDMNFEFKAKYDKYPNPGVKPWKADPKRPPDEEFEIGAITQPPPGPPPDGGNAEAEARTKRGISLGLKGLVIGVVAGLVTSYFWYILFLRILPVQLELKSASLIVLLSQSGIKEEEIEKDALPDNPLESLPFIVVIMCLVVSVVSEVAGITILFVSFNIVE